MSRNDNGRADLAAGNDPVRLILSRLQRVRQTGPSTWTASCPGPLHKRGDRNPSLSIRANESGIPLLCCHTGCDTGDLLAAIGLTFADLYPDHNGRHPDFWGSHPKFPWVPWRDVFNALRLDLTACGLAFRDLAAGKSFTPEEAEQLAKFADDLEYQLRRATHDR